MDFKIKKIIPFTLLWLFAATVGSVAQAYGAFTDNVLKIYSGELRSYEAPLKAYLGDTEELIMAASPLDASATISDASTPALIVMNILPTNSDSGGGAGNLSIVVTMEPAPTGTEGFGPFISTSLVTLTPYNEAGTQVTVTGTTGTDVTVDDFQVVASWKCIATGVPTRFEFMPDNTGVVQAINGIFGAAGGLWGGCVNG
jgi:hypothetical protein